MNEKQCTKCGLTKAFSDFYKDGEGTKSACKECYCEKIREKRYGGRCKKCLQAKRLTSNGSCKKCNDSLGLRQCLSCHQVLPLLIFFYEKTSTCKDCQKKKDRAASEAVKEKTGTE